MKKIGLYLETPPHHGGTFQYCQTMLEAVAALPRDRFEVVVGYANEIWQEYLTPYADKVKVVAVPRGFWGRAFGLAWLLLRLPMGLWRRLCPFFHPMAKAMLREKCDLWIFPAQDARSFQVPVPALVTILDLVHRYGRRFPEAVSNWEFLNREPTYANICRWAEGVVVVSQIDKQQVMEAYRISGERIHVLSMVPPRYIYDENAPENFDAKYRLPAKYIFYPAQFWEHKNHTNLLMAVAALMKQLPDLKLVLAGSKKNAWASVVTVMQELGLADDVILLGYVPDADMPELYRRARALVYATYYGPCNIPPLEALVAGCPIALSDVTSMPDRVGDAALIFKPDSVDEIADCIRRLWTDDQLCAEMSERGKRRAKDWGQEQFNERLEEIVMRLTGDKVTAK
jgi:glycosyltransferase involved in cell wall biosynthesis